MKKFLNVLLLISLLTSTSFAEDITLPKGSFIKVINQREISSAVADEGDAVTFINPTDVWINEYNIFPKNTIFIGTVSELHEPVQGTNASLKLNIHSVLYPNKITLPLKASVGENSSMVFGGEITSPMEYAKVPHYIHFYHLDKGVLQYTPGIKRYFGNHVVIKAGTELILQINDNFKLKN